MLALVVAGEMIFSLPFHVARYFRPSVLEGFVLSNAELGDLFAVYGVAAMLSYFPGGALADRVSARDLMCASLVATAAGGLYMASLPEPAGLAWLFGYWGVTTILLFWAPMIRATRRWGGELQGRAFGILDGGRGLAAAAFATAGVWVFTASVSSAAEELSELDRRAALRAVILFYSLATLASAWLVSRFVSREEPQRERVESLDLRDVHAVITRRDTWLQAAIVLCAYCGYKGLDNYGLYAVDALGASEVEAARFTAGAAYVRPLAAVLAGFAADRLRVSRVVAALFLLSALAYLILGSSVPGPGLAVVVYANVALTFFAVFGLRGVYFALLAEAGIPYRFTGAAVGLISLVGYTPDVFFAPVAGRLLDATPGIGGHQHYFLLLFVIAAAGLLATVALTALVRPAPGPSAPAPRPSPQS